MNNENLELIRQKCIETNPDRNEGWDWDSGLPSGSGYMHHAPCRLADVLLAIEKANGNVELNTYGELLHIGHYEKPDREGYYTKAYWNLRKDSLEDQSQETIDFLAGILQ